MAAGNFSPEVDLYIAKARPFALPVLEHLRQLIHKGCPEIVETIKWSHPFFVYRGAILCNMAAFKEHCSLGFWGNEIGAVLREAGVLEKEGMGSLGRMTSVKSLPSDKQMLGWIRQAAGFVDCGEYTSPIAARRQVVKAPKAAVELPGEFMTALKKNKKAMTVFTGFSPSGQREYVEWIASAKRAETRDKRIVEAVGWIAEGKQRNWKYQAC